MINHHFLMGEVNPDKNKDSVKDLRV